MAKELLPNLNRRQFVAGSLATGALLALAGCGKKTSDKGAGGSAAGAGNGAKGAVEGGTLKFYINNPASIDPYNAEESEGTQVINSLFDALTFYDYNAEKLKPLACESWETNEDATQFTFHLRKGATFHNGDPVTSKDFKYAWERIVNSKTNPSKPSSVNYHLASVAGYDELSTKGEGELKVETPDDLTLIVHLSAPNADFPFICAHPALSPVPSGGAAQDFNAFFVAPVGNGPFRMEGKWEDGQYIQVRRYDDYYGTKAKLSGIDFIVQKSPDTAFTEFEAGNLDYTDIPSGRFKETLEKYGEAEDDGYLTNPGHQTLTGGELSTYYMVCNVNDPVMSNLEIRKAYSYAVNRQAICDTIFEGTRKPADNVVPPGINGYEAGAWAECVYDKDKANKTLDAAGFPMKGEYRDISFTLSCNSGSNHEQIMQLIQADLKAVGIKSDLEVIEWATYLDKLKNHEYQTGRLGWLADYPIMDNYLFPLFFTGNADNRSGFSDPEVDKGILEARTIADTHDRVTRLREVNRKVAAQLPVIPLFFYRHSMVTSKRVNNLYCGPTKLCDFTSCWISE